MLPAHRATAVPSRRFGVRPLAALAAVLLVGAGLTTATAVVAATPASAAVSATTDGHFVCDQNTLYATNAAGKVVAIDISSADSKGSTVDVADLGTQANNGLGISREGTAMYAASNNVSATIRSFDPATNTASAPIATDKTRVVIRGAVNPVTGIYYYGDNTGWLGAYDPAKQQYLGQVGQINGLKNGNGDFAFSSGGLFFVVAADTVYRVNTDAVPSTSGTTALTTTAIATLPAGTSSPGIAFSSDGYLYVSNTTTANNVATTTIYQLDPTSGTQVRSFPVSGNFGATDLATCNYADTVAGQSSVDSRWNSGDQFGLAITGDGITSSSSGTTATTSGSNPGVQPQKAGAILVTPDKNYTVTQTASGTTDLNNYATTWKAVDVNSGRTVANGSGDTASFTFPKAVSSDGTDVVVTFANALQRTHVSTAPDTAVAESGETLTVPAAQGVLANDTGDGLTVVSNTTPAHGTATVNPDGSYTYTPADGFSGTDSFTYVAQDGSGQQKTGTVTITVTPTAADDAISVHAGAKADADAAHGLLANDTGNGLTVVGNTQPAHGTVSVDPDGAYRFTPADGFSGSDSFTYTAEDAKGHRTTATVTITVIPTAGPDTVAATAGQPTVGTAPGLLADDQGTDLTVAGNTQPSHGTVVVGKDGSYTYTPADGYSGPDQFDYTVTDGTSSDTVTVTVTVAPKAVDDAVSVTAGSAAVTTGRTDGVLGNDLGTGLAIITNTTPDHGALELDTTTGAYRYTPVDGFSGTDSFTYTVQDAAGATSTAKVTLTVVPAAADDTATTPANVPVTVDVQGNDHGTRLTTSIVTAPTSGTAVVAADGSIDYTPATGTSGTVTFTYHVTDGSGLVSRTATVTVTVTPRARPDNAATTADQPVTVAASTMVGNDVGTGLHVTAVHDATHGTVALDGNGDAVFTPASGFSGTGTFRYDVVDASGQTATSWVVVIVGPMAAPDSATATAGSTLTVSAADGVLSNDRGTDLSATIDVAPQHGTVQLASDGSYTYTPQDGYSGPDTFTYTAKDPDGDVSTGLVSITVKPSTVRDAITTAAGTPVTVTSRDLTDNDHGSGLKVTGVSDPGTGTVVLNADGTVTYTPAPGTSGTDTFTYQVTGANGLTATGTVDVTITPVVVAHDTTATADGELVVPADQGVLAGSTGTDLTVTGNTDTAHGTVTVGKDGSYTYTPTPGYSGKDTFQATVEDDSGNDTTATVTIVVAPKAVADTATTTANAAVDVPVTGNDSGTTLRVTAVGPLTSGSGTVAVSGTGTVTFTPAPESSGTATFDYTVTDAAGTTATATVTVTVKPVAVADALTTPSGTALPISSATLTGNDHGTGLQVTGHGDAAHGTVTVGQDGGLVYTPAAGFSGTDTFTYTATDASGQTTTATVTVLVGAVAVDHTARTSTNGTVKASAATGVLAGDSGSALWASVDRKPAHGTVTVAKDGSYVYTPDADWSGVDTFTYTATDAEGNTSTGLVTITVVPTVCDDSTRTTAGTTVTVKGPGVLGNDHGTKLTVVAVGTAAHGTVGIQADGTFVYTPAAGFSGIDHVTYTAQDASGQRVDGTVAITVGIAAANDSGTTIAGVAVAKDARHGLLGNDVGTGLTAALDRKPAHGTVTVAKDGSYVYTPAAGFTGTDTFTYTVTDASGQTTTATATIVVIAHAVATDDSATGTKGKPVTIDPLGNDTPTGGATFQRGTLHLLDPATGASVDRLVVDGEGTWTVTDGTVVFTPTADHTGTLQVGYVVTDSDGQVVKATITVVYPVGLAAKLHAAQLAFTGATGLTGLALAALALLLGGFALMLRRRNARA